MNGEILTNTAKQTFPFSIFPEGKPAPAFSSHSALCLTATSPAWSPSSENSGVIHGCEHTPADSFDGSLHDRSWLLCVSFELSSPTWAGYVHLSGCAGEGAGWQTGECHLFPPPQSKSARQMPGPPPTSQFHKTQGSRSGCLV